jgi:hypothetical protein
MERWIWNTLKEVLNHQPLQSDRLIQVLDGLEAGNKDCQAILEINGMMDCLTEYGPLCATSYFNKLDKETQSAVCDVLKFAQRSIRNNDHDCFHHARTAEIIPEDMPQNIENLLKAIRNSNSGNNFFSFLSSLDRLLTR